MKKGIILLITLFFMTAISVLVLRNIDDTDTFLEKQNYILNNTQILISLKNIQEQIENILSKAEKSEIENILGEDGITFPIMIDDLKIISNLVNYQRVNINEIKVENSSLVQTLFENNNIYDYSLFEESYYSILQTSDNKVHDVETNKQLDDIINDFISKSENQEIKKIRSELGFINNPKYELNVSVEYLGTVTKAYYLLDEKGEVLYFDISLI